ncbi:hypothetical protein TNCV_1834591 [Trichonephila clavipes]|nr:hypothetical protein TNCV_1834591 [Trichonephila clavipes]
MSVLNLTKNTCVVSETAVGERIWNVGVASVDRGFFPPGAYGRGKRKSLVLEAEALNCFGPEGMEFLRRESDHRGGLV